MFPLRDENPTLHASIATFLIIALNAAVWIFVQGFGFDPGLTRSVCQFGLIPGELLQRIPTGTEIPLAKGYACVIDNHPHWITLLSSMFMHGGWFHIIGNMWFLAVFGDNVEDAMGSFRFVIFYLVCGFTSAVAQIMIDPASPVPMVGASGAISGVMGAYAVLYPRAPVHLLVFLGFFITRIVVPAFVVLGYWFLLQFLGGFGSLGGSGGGVAFWAHIGGFIAGIVLIRLFCLSDRLDRCRSKRGKTSRIVRRYRSGR
jgi:membrane associated rhomboid family serine protease